MKIGDRIKEIRNNLGLSQGEFAKRLKFSQGAFSDFENNKQPLAEKYIHLICLEFGVNEEWLRTGKGRCFKESVNNRLKILRETLNLTQEEFAQKLHLTHTQISEIELSKSKVTEQTMIHLCTPNLFKEGKLVNHLWLRYGENSEETCHIKQPMFIKHSKQTEIYAADTISGPEILDDEGKPLNYIESRFINTYRRLSDSSKEVARTTVDALLKSQGGVSEKRENGETAGISPGDSGKTG